MEGNSLVLRVPEDPPGGLGTTYFLGGSGRSPCLLSLVYLYAISAKPLPSHSHADVMYYVNDKGLGISSSLSRPLPLASRFGRGLAFLLSSSCVGGGGGHGAYD